MQSDDLPSPERLSKINDPYWQTVIEWEIYLDSTQNSNLFYKYKL